MKVEFVEAIGYSTRIVAEARKRNHGNAHHQIPRSALGFWPKESLACLTLDNNHIGATLRVDLPRHDGAERTYARTVADYFAPGRQ